ncbi:MAG: type II secretion system protein [Candidatus Omnitrophota bacterium]
MPYYLTNKRSFTLIEAAVSTLIIALLITSIGQVFSLTSQSWSRQKHFFDMLRNSRWALDFISDEFRRGRSPMNTGSVLVGSSGSVQETLYFAVGNTRVWYWRGAQVGSESFGQPNTIYRSIDQTPVHPILISSLREARDNQREIAELVHFVVDNPRNTSTCGIANDRIFCDSGGLATITLTLRSNPQQPDSLNNRNYTSRTRVRLRN